MLKRLQNARTAEEASRLITYHYERPKDKEGDARKRAAIASEINQTVNITIAGSGDAYKDADAIRNSIKDANGLLIRNFNNPSR